MTEPSEPGDAISGAATLQAGSALQAPGTRRIVRRRLTLNGALVLVGALMLVIFTYAADHYGNDSAKLRDSGATVSGSVVEVDPGAASGFVMVAYTVDDHRYVEHVDLGDYVDDYEVGQTVDVYYEASNPAHMTIDDVDNQPGWTVGPMAMSLVLGICFLGYGLARLTRWIRVRRLLGSGRWDSGYLSRPIAFGRGRRLSMLADGTLIMLPLYGSLRVRPPGDVIRSCGPRHRVAISSQDGSWLVLARRARSQRQVARWVSRWPAGSSAKPSISGVTAPTSPSEIEALPLPAAASDPFAYLRRQNLLSTAFLLVVASGFAVALGTGWSWSLLLWGVGAGLLAAVGTRGVTQLAYVVIPASAEEIARSKRRARQRYRGFSLTTVATGAGAGIFAASTESPLPIFLFAAFAGVALLLPLAMLPRLRRRAAASQDVDVS